MKRVSLIAAFGFFLLLAGIFVYGAVVKTAPKKVVVVKNKPGELFVTTKPEPAVVLTAQTIRTHNTGGNCWIIISNIVYDVSAYIKDHPGGASSILPYCGGDATKAFNTKDLPSPKGHTSFAQNLLETFKVGPIGSTLGKLAGSVANDKSKELKKGDIVQAIHEVRVRTGPSDINTSIAVKVPPALGIVIGDRRFVSNKWWIRVNFGVGQSGWALEENLYRRNDLLANARLPADNADKFNGSTLTTLPEAEYTYEQVAPHKAITDCWIVVDNRVYDITSFLLSHPGGAQVVISSCGKESTKSFKTKNKLFSKDHTQTAYELLYPLYIGSILGSGASRPMPPTPPAPPPVAAPAPEPAPDPNAEPGYPLTEIAKHGSKDNCWIIVGGNVYDVTKYISLHPGGAALIIKYCGKDATKAFRSKEATPARDHSSEGYRILTTYFIGAVAELTIVEPEPEFLPPPPEATPPSSSPTPSPSPSTDSTEPSSPPPPLPSFPIQQIALHNSQASCWIVVNKRVYAVTSYLKSHPGGAAAILPYCGTDATRAYLTKDKTPAVNHTTAATLILGRYFIGVLSGISTLPTPPGTPPATPPGTPPAPPTTSGNTFLLRVFRAGFGDVVATNILCGSDCAEEYQAGATVSVHPFAHTGWIFKFWSGDCSGSGTCTVTMNEPHLVTATFDEGSGPTPPGTPPPGTPLPVTPSNTPPATPPTTPPATPPTVTPPPFTPPTPQPVTPPTPEPVTPPSFIPPPGPPTLTPPPPPPGYTPVNLAVHNTEVDCWIVVSGNIYDVSSYLFLHPGGKEIVIPYCGKDATVAFETKGKTPNQRHSAAAYALLSAYLIGPYVPPPASPGSTSSGSKFSINDRVQVLGTLNVRATGSTLGVLLGTQTTAALGVVLSGPVSQGGYNWWYINYDIGTDGWSAEDFLTTSSAPLPTP